MLSANALADAIMTAVQTQVTPKNLGSLLPIVGRAIAKYLTRNTEIAYSWSGIMPGSPSVPDPVTAYVTKNIAGNINMRATGASGQVQNGVILGKQITDGIKTFTITGAAGWAVSPGKFKAAPQIILSPAPAADFSKLWLQWSQTIIKTYKTYINSSPLAGTHGSFLAPPGAGAVMTQIF